MSERGEMYAANWWDHQNHAERIAWLMAHNLRPHWAFYSWRLIPEAQRGKIEMALWQGERQAA